MMQSILSIDFLRLYGNSTVYTHTVPGFPYFNCSKVHSKTVTGDQARKKKIIWSDFPF